MSSRPRAPGEVTPVRDLLVGSLFCLALVVVFGVLLSIPHPLTSLLTLMF